jgi:hypothetical protein
MTDNKIEARTEAIEAQLRELRSEVAMLRAMVADMRLALPATRAEKPSKRGPPNATTIEAMEAARRGELSGPFADAEALMKHLHASD